jgi:hypothetical protein
VFKGSVYHGTVVDRDVDSNNTGSAIYGVDYDDGDHEDLTASELTPLLLPADNSVRKPLMSDCAPCFVAEVADAAADMASDHRIPKHFRAIHKSPDKQLWMQAVNSELQALLDMHCYDLVDRDDVPAGAHIIGHTWVFRLKTNADGTISRYKARICVNGSQQVPGRDYGETYAPVAHAATIRLLLAVATKPTKIISG